MIDKKNSYKQIFRATSLFGGVKVLTIFFSIIRSKFIAVFLGPTGIGIVGLLNSTLSFIAILTNFGLERSTVKNIATANASKDFRRIGEVTTVLRRLVWLTGMLGAFVTIILSSYLSELTFGNKDYTIAFICLSITLFLNQISAGQSVVLRGMSKLTYMAKSSLFGAMSGLLISVPIYYFWRLDGIVPAIILSSIVTLFLTYYYYQKVGVNNVKLSKSFFLTESKDMVRMGLVLSLSSIVVVGESYLVRLFIRHTGSIADVGYYTAGFAIIHTYFGVIFTALTTDYYPRLAAIAHNNNKASLLMNQQSEMTILIIAPILVIFLVFINPLIVLLYSKEFIPINNMILWGGLGVFFKAASWALGVIFISKGDVKTLFWSELLATIVMLMLNLLGYKLFGLEGLGLSFLGGFIFAYIQTFLIVRFKYSFTYSIDFYKIFSIQLIIAILSLIIIRSENEIPIFLIGIVFIFLSIIFSLWYLDKNTDVLASIKKNYRLNDKKNKK